MFQTSKKLKNVTLHSWLLWMNWFLLCHTRFILTPWTYLPFLPHCFICFTVLTAEVYAPHYLGPFLRAWGNAASKALPAVNNGTLCVRVCVLRVHTCTQLSAARTSKNSSRLLPKLATFSCSQLCVDVTVQVCHFDQKLLSPPPPPKSTFGGKRNSNLSSKQ